MEIILKYFPDLSTEQIGKFEQLGGLYAEWNEKINVISRKDISELYERHVLHSLAIAKLISFKTGSSILDVGTGGGFPGIPLAILFPEVQFFLVDSIGKKIKVVTEISQTIGLTNLTAQQIRAEELNQKFDFIVSRAVTALPKFVDWTRKSISTKQINAMPNGILYLKGGDIEEEIKPFRNKISIQNLSDYFNEPFFETKKLIYLPG